ncbi:hypothetical protein E5288_WYG001863 [Bos mutus]|uniref:Uncharacterized protein n=1 Tax=Bos mutus TaxID=72004 RepID=A0A6B0S2F7_9CETA|nr:hypothetical protein [Bos mutus]
MLNLWKRSSWALRRETWRDRAGHLAFSVGLDSVPRRMWKRPLDGAPGLEAKKKY